MCQATSLSTKCVMKLSRSHSGRSAVLPRRRFRAGAKALIEPRTQLLRQALSAEAVQLLVLLDR